VDKLLVFLSLRTSFSAYNWFEMSSTSERPSWHEVVEVGFFLHTLLLCATGNAP